MAIDTEGAASAAPASAPAETDFQETVLSLLTEMSARLAKTDQRLDALEAPDGPRYRQQTVDSLSAPGDRLQRMEHATPDGVPRSDTIAQFPNGERVPEMVMRQYRPRFGSGDLIRLNLDAVPHGRSDGRTRGELMGEKGTQNGYGEVLDRSFLSDQTGQWKYRVKFDAKTMPGSNGGIVSLYEPEMLPA